MRYERGGGHALWRRAIAALVQRGTRSAHCVPQACRSLKRGLQGAGGGEASNFFLVVVVTAPRSAPRFHTVTYPPHQMLLQSDTHGGRRGLGAEGGLGGAASVLVE